MFSLTDSKTISASLHVNTNHRLRLCGLWQPDGSIKGGPCFENQRHTGPDGQGEFVAGARVCMCVCAWVDTCIRAYLPCLWTCLMACACLMRACGQYVLGERQTDHMTHMNKLFFPWPHLFSRCHVSLCQITCHSACHVIQGTVILHSNTASSLKSQLIEIYYNVTYAYVNVMSASGHCGNHSMLLVIPVIIKHTGSDSEPVLCALLYLVWPLSLGR